MLQQLMQGRRLPGFFPESSPMPGALDFKSLPQNVKVGLMMGGLGDIMRGGSGQNALGLASMMAGAAHEDKMQQEANDLMSGLFGGQTPTRISSSGATAPRVSPNSAIGSDVSDPRRGAMPTGSAGVNMRQRIRQGLIDRGLPEHIADGFLMNMQDESGLDPGINERNPTVPGSRGGYGLYQLTGPRRVAYEQFAQERGVNPADVDAQLDFLVKELQGPESAAARSIFSTQNRGDAAAAIARDFLRPAPEHLQRRVAQYTGGGGGGMPQIDPQRAMQIMQHPNIPNAVKQMVMQQMQGPDPMDQLRMREMQLRINQMENPPAADRQTARDVNGLLRYLDTGEQVFANVEPEVDEAEELSLEAMRLKNEAARRELSGGVESGPDVKGESDLRKEFSGLQPVKEFQKQAQAYGRIVASAQNPSAAGDLALIFNYMKLLDPGSVVRESEFATAQNAAGVPDRIRNLFNRVQRGERLAEDQRQDFVGRSARLYREAETQHEQLAGQYGLTAEQYGLNRDRTIPDYRYRPEGAPPTSQRPQGAMRTPQAAVMSQGLPPAPEGIDQANWPAIWAAMPEEDRAMFR